MVGWNPPPSAVVGYEICYGKYKNRCDYVVNVGKNTSCSISGLKEGNTYYFAVKAYNARGKKSVYSKRLKYTVPVSDSTRNSPKTNSAKSLKSDSSKKSSNTIPVANSNRNSATHSNPALKLEIGELRINHNWKYVKYKNAYADPIVIANSMSLNGGDPAVIRIRKVGQSGFEIRVQEWDYLNDIHTVEAASYLVIERGNYTLADGTKVEAGLFETDKTGSFAQVRFKQAFQRKPVVITSISSFNGADAVAARLRNINTDGFGFCMQEQEGNDQFHTTETIGYIAWEPSIGTVNGLAFVVRKTSDSVTHNFYTIQFAQNFATTPTFTAAMQTSDGMDTANIRWRNKDAYAVEVQIDEEQSRDTETNHTTEVVGYMAFSQQ
jgi:hypothetical protein